MCVKPMPPNWWIAEHALALRDPDTGCLLIYDSDEWADEDMLDNLKGVSQTLDRMLRR